MSAGVKPTIAGIGGVTGARLASRRSSCGEFLVRKPLAELAAPWVVLALGLFLRLWQIDLTRFSNEAVWLLQATNDFINSGHIPLHSGLAFSIGAWAPPLITFLLAPLALLSRDPLWISAGLAVLDSLGCLFVFWAARRLTSSMWAGVAAGLAYAAAPAGLLYGRIIWNVTLVPVLSAIALWGLVEFQLRRRSLALAVALVAIGGAAQLHFVNAIYALPWIAAALAGWKYVQWRHIAVAAGLLLATLVPYVVLQLRTGWADIGLVLGFLAKPKHVDAQVFDTAGALIGTTSFWRFLPTVVGFPWFNFDAMTWTCIAITCVGLMYAPIVRRFAHTIVVVWLALPLAFSIRHSVDVLPYYLLGQVPAVCLLQGLAAVGLITAGRKVARTRATATIALLPMLFGGGEPAARRDRTIPQLREPSGGRRAPGYLWHSATLLEGCRQLASIDRWQ